MSGFGDFSAENLVDAVKENFKSEALSRIVSSTKDKDILIFLGSTGTGKSTMLNYLAGCTMLENDEGDIIVSEESGIKSVADIGHSTKESKTFLPSFHETSTLNYYDSPGLGDTKGITQEVINAKLIRELAKNAKSVRFVILLREAHGKDRASRSMMLDVFKAVRSFFAYDKEISLTIFLTHVKTKKIAREKLVENVKDNIVTSTEFKSITVECFDPLDKESREFFVKKLQDLRPLALKEKAIKIPLGDKEKSELKLLLSSEYKSLEKKWRKIKESLIKDCESYLLAPSITEEELSQRLKQVDELIKAVEQVKQTTKNNVKPYSDKLNAFLGSGSGLKQQIIEVQGKYRNVAREVEELLEMKPFNLVELADLKPIYESGMLKLKSMESERLHKEELERQQREAREALERLERQRREDLERIERQRREDNERMDRQRREDMESQRYELERERKAREEAERREREARQQPLIIRENNDNIVTGLVRTIGKFLPF